MADDLVRQREQPFIVEQLWKLMEYMWNIGGAASEHVVLVVETDGVHVQGAMRVQRGCDFFHHTPATPLRGTP
jgi:hypothetical protein